MFRQILVPLDGSPLAERALPFAQEIAAAGNARLVLLRAVSVSETHPDEIATTDHPAEVTEAESYLHDLAQRLSGVTTDSMVEKGDATVLVLAEIARRSVDLVAMSTHGRSGIGRWIYGSVADAILRHAPTPVLLVSGTTKMSRWRTDRPRRILISLDCSALSETVLAPACTLADTLKAEIILLSVSPLLMSPDPYGGAYLAYDPDVDRTERRTYLEGIATTLRARDRKVAVRDAFGLVDTTILDVAREEDVDLIALATHGNSGVTRLLMGSVATSIVQRAAVPLLVVRPADVREES
ncbi:MAG TPA: universal stress protein [Chloroflexota bacterium]|nr:universal stress protein [Chloroflexota bacterium]